MGETVQIKAVPAKPLKTTPLMRRVTIYIALPLVFFLLGFLPLWVRSREAAVRLSDTENGLRLAQLQNALGSAVIDAQRGDYEPALVSVSSFYTSLQAEIDGGEASAFSPAEQAAMRPMFNGRDELIALLARGDPAAATRLSDLYVSFQQSLTGRVALGVEEKAKHTRETARADQVPGKTNRDQN